VGTAVAVRARNGDCTSWLSSVLGCGRAAEAIVSVCRTLLEERRARRAGSEGCFKDDDDERVGMEEEEEEDAAEALGLGER
jgi:hypothetical protein